MTTEADPARFAHVTDWVFDLDNTLYPHHSNLFSQIDVKMTAYVSELLKLPREEARKLQKELYLEYGTTLNGLMNRHGIDPDDFLEKVHDIDYSWLKPDPVLGAAIRQLPGRKFIFTNGNRSHAERTARQLGILDHFDDIFDIIAAGLNPKPAPRNLRSVPRLLRRGRPQCGDVRGSRAQSRRAQGARHDHRADRAAQFRADLLRDLGARRSQ